MASNPPHPLSKPHLDKLAGLIELNDLAPAEEIERRVQNLLNEWQKFYFSGNAFTTPLAGAADEEKTFDACEILWGRSIPENPGRLPILHTVLVDRRDGDKRRMPGGIFKVTGDWTWNMFVRAHPQMPAAPDAPPPDHNDAFTTADRTVRRVGDQLAWLLRSPHAAELAFKGIGHLRLLSGPRPVQSGSWMLNQLIVTAKITFRLSGNV